MTRLFGPLPQLYRAGKFWREEYITETFGQGGTFLAQHLDDEGVNSELIDFIMKMLDLDPEKRISARDALRHEWLVGPLLGYWAVLGLEWSAADKHEPPTDTAERELIESRTPNPETRNSPPVEHKSLPIYDFSKMEDEEDDNEDVSFVYAGYSPTKSLPFKEPKIPPQPEEQVFATFINKTYLRKMMKYCYCK